MSNFMSQHHVLAELLVVIVGFVLFTLWASKRNSRLKRAEAEAEAKEKAERYAKFKVDFQAYPSRYREAVAFCGADAENSEVKHSLRNGKYNFGLSADYERLGQHDSACECLTAAETWIRRAMRETESIRCVRDARAKLESGKSE